MDELRVLMTKKPWNIGSHIIRQVLPRTFYLPAFSSHAMVVDGNYAIEAVMFGGVRRIPLADALRSAVIVRDITFAVPCAESGIEFGRQAVLRRIPYDFRGAFGLAIAPDRDWQEPDMFFCYELVATILREAGLNIFAEYGHITETVLLSVNPKIAIDCKII